MFLKTLTLLAALPLLLPQWVCVCHAGEVCRLLGGQTEPPHEDADEDHVPSCPTVRKLTDAGLDRVPVPAPAGPAEWVSPAMEPAARPDFLPVFDPLLEPRAANPPLYVILRAWRI